MKITNINNLPEQLVDVVSSDYKPKEKQYSCTTILKPTRQIILERKYNDVITQDVSDMCWLIFGIAVHSIVEQGKETDSQFKEEYLIEELGKFDPRLEGYKLSGRSDLIDLEKQEIVDWKSCSIWKVIYGDYDDWKKETLIYAWLVKQMGFDIKKARIVAFMKDHKKNEAKYKKDYPKFPIHTIEFEFTEEDFAEIEEYIITKFLEIKYYEEANDFDLPMCSLKERFNRGNEYAIKKKGNTRALKVHDTFDEAREHLINLENKYPGVYELEERKGEDTKCISYCQCNKQCPYYLMNYDENVKEIHLEMAERNVANV